MIDLSVVFKVPEWLAAGLESGELERVGGVIRDKVTKKVVAWLKEGDTISTEPPSEVLNGQLSQLMMQGQVLMGLQMANLAVSTIGFAMIYRKLQGIERKLEGIQSGVEQLQDGQKWQDRKAFISHLAPVMSATGALSSLRSYKSADFAQNKLMHAERQFDTAEYYFKRVTLELMSERKHYARNIEFAMNYRSWIIAAQGKVQSLYQLGESVAAVDAAVRLQSEHADFGKELASLLAAPLHRFAPGNYEGGDALTLFSQQAVQTHQILKGNALQLVFMNDNDVQVQQELISTEIDQSGLLIYIPR